MGKRKRSFPASTNLSSDSVPCSSGRDVTPGENSSDPDDSSIFKPFSSAKRNMDSLGKQPNAQISLGQHHYNMSRAMFLKRSRHHYGNQYSRRNSHNYHKPSTSYGKNSPSHDDRLCFRLGSRYNSDFGHRPDFTEFREKPFWVPERIRASSSSMMDTVAPETANMVCGICQKLLRRKPHHHGATLSPEELSIAAVLVCGHVYHADCLEKRTLQEDIRDPPCPMCLGSIPKAEAA